MNNLSVSKTQTNSTDLLNDLKIAIRKTRFRTLLHHFGFRKVRGISVFDILTAFFLLPFSKQSVSEGIVNNPDIGFGKDALYSLLNCPRYNWRRLLMKISCLLTSMIWELTDREKVLIIDSTAYSRNRSKSVELLSRVKDHSTGNYIRGFRMETLALSDGHSLIPTDFALLANSSSNKRFCEMRDDIDKRTCGFSRRKEALCKATDVVVKMVERVSKACIQFNHILVDSWYAKPATILRLHCFAPVICMLPKGKATYKVDGKKLNVKKIYASLRKKRGKAKILASTQVLLNDEVSATIVFVRHRSKKDWLAILSTDITLSPEEIVRIYGKRWDIEIFFKMAKQHLRMESEIQSRSFDALVAQVSIVFLRYQFMIWRQRTYDDHRTFGELFRSCCDEIKDITLLESIERIIDMVLENVSIRCNSGSISIKSLATILNMWLISFLAQRKVS